MRKHTRTIRVDTLARVEGEGALHIKLVGERVTEVKLKIYEPPRFFEAFLRGRLDRLTAVPGPHPRYGPVERQTREYRQAGERGTGAAVTADATELDSLATASPLEKRRERRQQRASVVGTAEVGPTHVAMWPRRLPAGIEVEAVVGSLLACVRVVRIKRHRGDLGPVRQQHDISMAVDLESPVLVARLVTFRLLRVRIPVHLAAGTSEHCPRFRHPRRPRSGYS